MAYKCILFDRDGTLGELQDKRYPQTFSPFCDVKAVFSKLKEKGYLVGILTNQSSIARGTGAGYDFEKEFLSYGVDVWKICPHDDKDNCACRKPKSGLLLSACQDLGLSPTECILVGDRLSDITCANGVGGTGVLVLTGFGLNERALVLERYPATPILNSFDEILEIL